MDKQDSGGGGNNNSSNMKRKHKPIQPPSPSPNSDGDEDRHGHRDRRKQPKRSVFRRLGGAPREQHQKAHQLRECRHWIAHGSCPFGSSCSFAHPALRHQHHAPRTPPPQESRRRYSRPPPEPSPRRVARDNNDNEQEDSTPTGIRSAVIVTQTSAEKSTSKLSVARKVRLTDKKSRDQNDDLQMPGNSGLMGNPNSANNNKYEFEFESAYELEKRRQELKRRLEELNDVTSNGQGGALSGAGGAPGGSGMSKMVPSFGPGSPQQEKKKFRHSDSKPLMAARAQSRDRDRDSRDDRDRDRDDVRERDRERERDRDRDKDRDRERERDIEARSAGPVRRRPEYPSPKFERYPDSRGDNMRERDRDRIIDQKSRGYRSVSRDDRDQRADPNIRRRAEFSPQKIDRDRYSDSRAGENLRESGRHSAEKTRVYRPLNRDDRDQRMADNPRRRLDYSSPNRFSDSKGDNLRDKRSLDRPPIRDRNVHSSPMPPPRSNRLSNQKPMPLNLAPPTTSRLALLKQRRRNLRTYRRQPPTGGAGGGGVRGGGILSSANAVPLNRRHITGGGGGRFGGKETSSMGSGAGTPRPLVRNADNRPPRRLPLGGGGGQSHARAGVSSFNAGRSRLANSAHGNNAAYNAMSKLRRIHAKRERERKERKSLKRPVDLNESSFDKSSSSRPRKRFRADSDKYSANRDNTSMDRGDHRRAVDRPRSSRDKSQRRDGGGPVTPPSYRSSTRKSMDRGLQPHRQQQQPGDHFEKRDSYASLFVNSFTNVNDSTINVVDTNHGGSHVTSKPTDECGQSSKYYEKIDKNKGSRGGTPGGADSAHRHGHHHRSDPEKFEKSDENRSKSNSHHENNGPIGAPESHVMPETNEKNEHTGPKSESETDGGAGQDLEPISDEEVQEDANFCSAAIEALRVDWSALTKDKTFNQSKSLAAATDENAPPLTAAPVDQSESSAVSPLTKFKPENFLNSAGLSAKLLGPDLIAKIESSVNAKLKEKGDDSIFKFDLEKDNRSKLAKNPSERLKILNDVGPFRKALSARVDLKIRRKLCGFYAEPPDNLLLNTSEICIPFNEEAFETAKKLYLKNRQQIKT